jgi:hypothetical protein
MTPDVQCACTYDVPCWRHDGSPCADNAGAFDLRHPAQTSAFDRDLMGRLRAEVERLTGDNERLRAELEDIARWEVLYGGTNDGTVPDGGDEGGACRSCGYLEPDHPKSWCPDFVSYEGEEVGGDDD